MNSRIRTKEQNYLDAMQAEATNKPVNGWKETNAFQDLAHFSVIDGFPPDIMHDFLEGTLVYNMGLLLNELKENHILPFKTLISEMASFEYGRTDVKNKLSKEPFKKSAYDKPKGICNLYI